MATNEPAKLTRERLPDVRHGKVKKFKLPYTHKDGTPDVMKFYIRTGCCEDGRLGEVFITTDKVGTLASGMIDAVAMLISMMLQYGIPLDEITKKLRGINFQPSGFIRRGDGTIDPEIHSCTSPLDLLAQFLELKHGKPHTP